MFDLKNYRNPLLFFIEEAVLAVLFYALVICSPLLDALVSSGISRGLSSILVGVVGFVILWLMDRAWKRYGPISSRKG
ncbi:MAG: hypothetical protein MR009_00870 [Sutterellaceae bacterium]|nr:hypothetical protein [Sutterellaceae bacterium]MDD7442063.1 hypothetical protein [Sutterellaceae bacterium]MDY2869150.1 hypothetical protein [Mesosutterella sp.]